MTRGGLALTSIIAFELEIRSIDTLCISSHFDLTAREAKVLKAPAAEWAGDGSGLLVIEDLVDTGQTAKIIRKLYPKAYFVAYLAKPLGKPFVDKYMIDVAQNTWIDFPWEIPVGPAENSAYK